MGLPVNRVILAYSHQPRQLPPRLHAALRERLPYGRRMRLRGDLRAQAQTLVGIELARRLLAQASGREVATADLRFPYGGKPRAPGLADFSISHCGAWVGCAVATAGRVGFDLERAAAGAARDPADWAAREAVLKAAGGTLDEAARVEFDGAGAVFAGQRWRLLAPPAPPGCVARVALEGPAELELVPLMAITENSAFDARLPAGRPAP
jgi:phosphopantetheinyl transferase